VHGKHAYGIISRHHDTPVLMNYDVSTVLHEVSSYNMWRFG